MNYCRECGNKLNESGDFCPNCGLKYEVKASTNVAVRKKTNGLATVGMIIGIVSMIFSMWGIMSVVSIIISSIARRQIRDNNENGDGMAIAGLCCGVLSLIGIMLFWGIDSL